MDPRSINDEALKYQDIFFRRSVNFPSRVPHIEYVHAPPFEDPRAERS